MTDQLQMIWPEDGVAERPEWHVPAGYRSRGYREGDAEAYIDLMRMSGFDAWGRHDLDNVLEYAVPNGIIFVEHVASSKIVGTAMGWRRPASVVPDACEMGWVAVDPEHRGKGLGKFVTAAATQALLEHGAQYIYLLTDDWRLPAIKGYLKVGYAPIYHKPGMKKRWQELFLALGLNMEAYKESAEVNNAVDRDEE